MGPHVCPWWYGWVIDNPLRRLLHDPVRLLSPWVSAGMTVADIGCGMGIFSLGLAELVGEAGRVHAVDLQPRMLATLERRARKAGLGHRITTRVCSANDIGPLPEVDFALGFWVVHESPAPAQMLAQLAVALRPEGRLLVAEPRLHIGSRDFAGLLAVAAQAGLEPIARPPIRWSRAALLVRRPAGDGPSASPAS